MKVAERVRKPKPERYGITATITEDQRVRLDKMIKETERGTSFLVRKAIENLLTSEGY